MCHVHCQVLTSCNLLRKEFVGLEQSIIASAIKLVCLVKNHSSLLKKQLLTIDLTKT